MREQCAWVHMNEPDKATRKAKELVRMAVARAATLAPVYKNTIQPVARALVLGVIDGLRGRMGRTMEPTAS
jgi:heterodisulfide reductase subunit A